MPRKLKAREREYHVALSFAGEDREYVERVADRLLAAGVKVFYDGFEEARLWGKDLYVHLSDVYRKKALYTVIFASKHYRKKLWTNRERQSAQERAFESNKEYILPALFDKSVAVPGMLKTTGYISLWNREPEAVADLIIEKLRDSGVKLGTDFSYSDEARADVDFPRHEGGAFTEIMSGLKSRHWPTQAPAVRAIFDLDWSTLDKNQIFVLGRNIYQCAEGEEHAAEAIVKNLRKELAKVPPDAATHLLNGMFFEAYFNKEGRFRGNRLKRKYLEHLLELQTVKKFAPSISFINRELQPYAAYLPYIPSTPPEVAKFDVTVSKSDPSSIKSVILKGRELLTREDEEERFPERGWVVSFSKCTVNQLKERLSEKWSIPIEQIEMNFSEGNDRKAEYRLLEGHIIKWPEPGKSR